MNLDEKSRIVDYLKDKIANCKNASDVDVTENKISYCLKYKMYGDIKVEVKVRKNGDVGTLKAQLRYNVAKDTNRKNIADEMCKDNDYINIVQEETDELIIQKAISFADAAPGNESEYLAENLDKLLKVIDDHIDDFEHTISDIRIQENPKVEITEEGSKAESIPVVTETVDANAGSDISEKSDEINITMDDTEDIEEELRLIREEEAEIKRYYDNKEVDKEVTSKVVDKVKKSAPMTEINIPENNSRSRENNSRPRPDKKKSNLSKPIQAQPVHKDVHKSNDRVALPGTIREQIDAAYAEIDAIFAERTAQMNEREATLNKYADSVKEQEKIANEHAKAVEDEYIKKTVILEDEFEEKKKTLEKEYKTKNILFENSCNKKIEDLESEHKSRMESLEREYQEKRTALESEFSKKEAELVEKCAHRESECDRRESELEEKINEMFSEKKRMEFEKKKIKIEKETLRARENDISEKAELFGTLENTISSDSNLSAENNRLQEEKNALVEQITELSAKISDLEAKQQPTAPADNETDLEKKLHRLEKVYAKKDNFIDKLKNKLDDRNAEIERLLADTNSSSNIDQAALEEANRKIENLKNDLEKSRHEVEKLSAGADKARITDLESEIRAYGSELEKVRGDLDVAMTSLDEKEHILSEKENEIRCLNEEITNMKNNASGNEFVYGMDASGKEDLKSKAESIKQDLHKIGLDVEVFPTSGNFILNGERNGCSINIDLDENVIYSEKSVKKALKYRKETEDWTQENIRVSYTVSADGNKVICKYFFDDPLKAVMEILEKMDNVI